MRTVEVAEVPDCDFCEQGMCPGDFEVREAMYDGPTTLGPHAFMCETAYSKWGIPSSSITVRLKAYDGR
jgi:hypothetical protein